MRGREGMGWGRGGVEGFPAFEGRGVTRFACVIQDPQRILIETLSVIAGWD